MDVGKISMYPSILPSIDDSAITPEILSLNELDEVIDVMIISNETIRAENDLLETYLANTDPQLIENMDSILDAATAAIHKAERTVQLGMMAAVTTVQDSSSTTPRSVSQGSAKIAAFTLSDKGPKIQPSQKMEIIQREMDCLRALFDDNKIKNDSNIFHFECKKIALEMRLQDIVTLSKLLQEAVTNQWIEHSAKVPGEKMIAYFEHRNRCDLALIKNLSTKRKNLKIKIDALNIKIKELGDEMKYVDYEKLIIEDQQLHKNLGNLSLKVAGLKKTNTVYLNAVGRIQDKIHRQLEEARNIEKNISRTKKKIAVILDKETKILKDLDVKQERINFVTEKIKKFAAPSIMDYVRHKDELQFTRQALHVVGRRQHLYEMIDNNLKQKTIQRVKSDEQVTN